GLRISKLNINTYTSDDTEDWVEVKIIQGSSHAFLQMPALLPENAELIHEDEGLTFTPRRSKTSSITHSQENENKNFILQDSDYVQEPISIDHLHVSRSLPNISNDNIQKSTTTTVIAPGHEIWEQNNILNENEVLKRRRDTLVRNLAEGCNATTIIEHSTLEKVTK
ncbi:9849_t:CDS:2, partial [Scutellospora calospora]